jgi:hypothetical protein
VGLCRNIYLIEAYRSRIDEETLLHYQEASIEIGFLINDEVNLIIIAYRFLPNDWNVIPYLWQAYPENSRIFPPEGPLSMLQRKFTVAVVETNGGIYRVIREGYMLDDFASAFNSAIHRQIANGLPDREKYKYEVEHLYELMDDKLDSKINAKFTIS